MVPRERHTLFAADPLARPLKEVDSDVTASSLLFSLQSYCTRRFQARERRAAKPWDPINEGVSPTKESAVREFSRLVPINVVVCNRAGWDKN